MTPETTILLILLLLFIGISMTFNNQFITFVLNNLFFGSNLSNAIVRFLGLGVLSSIVLILLHMNYYALLVNTLVFLLFLFFTVQGRARVKQVAEQKRLEKEAQHKANIEAQRVELARARARKIKDLEDSRNKPQSVKDMKGKLWNDGSLTSKELIRDLNKE